MKIIKWRLGGGDTIVMYVFHGLRLKGLYWVMMAGTMQLARNDFSISQLGWLHMVRETSGCIDAGSKLAVLIGTINTIATGSNPTVAFCSSL
jgi:hypothetical protein